MSDNKRYDTARKVTGSNATDETINIQYTTFSRNDKFLLIGEVGKVLKTYSVSLEVGWELLKNVFDGIATKHSIDPATAYCVYSDWIKSGKNKEHVFR